MIEGKSLRFIALTFLIYFFLVSNVSLDPGFVRQVEYYALVSIMYLVLGIVLYGCMRWVGLIPVISSRKVKINEVKKRLK